MNRSWRFEGKGAFTLVELLISIALLAVLLALSAAGYSKITERSRAALCLVNLRQISTLLSAYLADHRQVYPLCTWRNSDETANRFWGEKLMAYTVDRSELASFICPGANKANLNPSLKARKGGFAYISYGINRYGVAPAESDTPRLHPAVHNRIEEPSRLLVLIDSEAENQPWDGWYWANLTYVMDNWEAITRRHQLPNALFADGHVRAMTREEVNTVPISDHPWATNQYTLYR